MSDSTHPYNRRLNERRVSDSTSVDALASDARIILANCGVVMSPSKVGHLVRRYRQQVECNGFAFFEYLTNALQVSEERRHRALASPEVARVIGYADPTGEIACRRVMEAS